MATFAFPLSHGLPREGGLYLLGLWLERPRLLTIGALGTFEMPRGLYLYAGSAWGRGGLAARLGRHLRGDGRPHWHIDALRRVALPACFCLYPGRRDECALARQLLALPAAQVIVPRFGASDCRCPAHLVWVGGAS